MKKAIVAVINDLVTDQRVNRTCLALLKQDHRVILVGRKLPASSPVGVRPYKTHRMRLLFRKGPFFYLFFNTRLFFYLLFHKADLIVANDLDTLPACSLAASLKGCKLWYDTHEVFCEVPELVNTGWKKRTWERIERRFFPGLKYISTVNVSIASFYKEKYGKDLLVIRNIPAAPVPAERRSKKSLGMPEHKRILVLQGSGINMHRGAEEMVDAMKYLENMVLYIIGSGDVVGDLMVRAKGMQEKVIFLPRMPYAELMQYTMNADAGLTLDKDSNLNYKFSLPNKIFDYIHCGIPVIASSLPEINRIFSSYNIGVRIPSHDPASIAETIHGFFAEPGRYLMAKAEVARAAKEYTWEKEEQVIHKLISTMS